MSTWTDLERDQQLLELLYPKSQLRDHLLARVRSALAKSAKNRNEIVDEIGLERHRSQMRNAFLNSIGGIPASTPTTSSTCSGILYGDDFAIEKITYQPRPNTSISAHLYLPKNTPGKTAAVLFLCGHNIDGKAYPPYQAICQRLAHAGMAVLIQDPIGQGERLEYGNPPNGFSPMLAGVTEHDHAGNQCMPIGDGIARYFLHDAIQGIALLRSRAEIDPKRIGVAGFSGGGTQTAMVMLADPGIAAAAPGIYITDREACLPTDIAQDAEQVWPGFLGSGFDHADILLAIAPRPVHVFSASYDYFPIEGSRRSVKHAQEVCSRLKMGNCISLTESRVLHSLSPELAQATTDFFAKELLGKTSPPIEPRPFDEKSLRCFEGRHARTSPPSIGTVFKETAHRAKLSIDNRKDRPAEQRRHDFTKWLHAAATSNRTQASPNLRVMPNWQLFEEMRTESGIWWSQAGICNYGRLFAPALVPGPLQVTVAIWDGGTTCLRPHLPWLRQTCATGRAVLVLDTTGAGAIAPLPTNAKSPESPYGAMRCLSDTLFWLGDSLMAMRIYDCMRAIDAIGEWPGLTTQNIEAYACGHLGECLLAATAIDRRYARISSTSIEKTANWVLNPYYDEHLIRTKIMPGSLLHGDWDDLTGF